MTEGFDSAVRFGVQESVLRNGESCTNCEKQKRLVRFQPKSGEL